MDLLPFEAPSAEVDFSTGNFTSFGISPAMDATNPNDFKNLFQGFSPWLLYFASFCCVVFMLVGIPGNLFTIIALARCKKVRNATAVFIINLSCSDLLYCCFNLPLAATTFYYREWVHGELMCHLFPLFRYGLLAVSLFSILTITINRYIMIGHPRIYPRIYRRRWLALMVSLTWICAFASLIQTWRGKWGKFGMDINIGSCSILPVNDKSPKEFLFVMAFILPCFSIVLCYARIFYIVRKTAMKTHEVPKTNGSIRLSHNHTAVRKTPSPIPHAANKMSNQTQEQQQQKYQRPSIEIEIDECNGDLETKEENKNEIVHSTNNINDVNRRKVLAKSRNEDIKFIDTSCESDLPPTLSQLQLQRKSVQISIESAPAATAISSSTISPTTIDTVGTTIISLENENVQLKLINKADEVNAMPSNNMGNEAIIDGGTTKASNDMGVDSAVEDSTVSLEQNNVAHHLLSIPEPSSSSSGIELPYDIQESPKKKTKKLLKPSKPANAKIKQKKIKDEAQSTKDGVVVLRKKSLANTSGASILNGAARMSAKDRRLLKMILVIFISFLTCYLPITLTKVMRSIADINFLFITSYLLVYLTTCINPIIYVVMSSEYRQAYKQLFTCHFNNSHGCNGNAKYRNAGRRI